MAIDPIPKKVKNVWNEWNIRGIILFSLSLQTFLILFAPLRKGSGNKFLIMLIWSAYLLADWAANYAVGLISDSQNNKPEPSGPQHNTDLLAFWPTFLLLHLGGPDTITALALEDNELWLRHMLGLITQAASSVYAFLQSLPGNALLVPSILMFAAGVIKYFERTRALYLGSLDKFRDSMLQEPDPGPNYAKLMDEYASKIKAQLPARIITIPEPDKKLKAEPKKIKLSDLDVVKHANRYFNIFKGLIVDLIFSFRERDESRNFFRTLYAEDALKIIEVELNFIYEVFYTKVEVIHQLLGYTFRFIASGSVVVALWYFNFRVKKNDFKGFDVGVTYTLFWGAIALDIVSFFIFIFSDWTLAALTRDKENSAGSGVKKAIKSFIATYILQGFLYFKSPWWQEDHFVHKFDGKNVKLKQDLLATPSIFRRWSGSISGYNLIRYCLKGSPTKVHKVHNWFLLYTKKVIWSVAYPFKMLICPCIIIFIHYLGSIWREFICVLGMIWRTFIDGLRTILNNFIGYLGFIIVIVIHFLLLGRVSTDVLDKYWSKFITGLGDIWRELINGLGYIWRKSIQCLVWIKDHVIDFFGFQDLLDEIWYVSHEPFTKELWMFIFKEIETKAQYADDPEAAESISSAKGEWVMQDWDPNGKQVNELLNYVTDVAYDESLLLWHIATELIYFQDKQGEKSDDKNSSSDPAIESPELQKEYNGREFSKILSDYMLYLMIMQPTMMSAVAGIGKIRFRDTLAEAKRFFARKNLKSTQEKEACEEILKVITYVKPSAVKGDRSKSVLFDGSMLAQELNKLERKERWELVSRVWVELLSYAASHVDARTHAQQVSRGGELITFVWLLMAHFGLGEQFKINKGQGRSKLIVGK